MEPQNPQEDLALIRRMMEEVRRDVVDRGRHFMIWGVMPTLGALATWLYAAGVAVPAPQWSWTGLLVVGWAASMVVGWRDGRGARVRTFGRRMLSIVWVCVAVSLTIIALAGMFGAVVDVVALSGLVSVVIAAPVAMTAGLTGERWLYGVAGGWWVGGAVMLFVPGVNALLLMGAMSLLLLAVPGAVLNARSRRDHGHRSAVADVA